MRKYLASNPQEALKASEYGIEYAIESKDSLTIAKALFSNAFILKRLDRYAESIEIFNHAYGVASRNQFNSEIIRISNSIALAYTFTSKYDLALKYHFESLVINEKIGALEDAGITLNNIGIVYYKLENYDEALKYFFKSKEVKEKINSEYDLDGLYINIALCHNQLNDFEKAERYVNEALDICKVDCSELIKMEAKHVLGISARYKKDYLKAEVFFNESLVLAEKLKDSRYIIENLSNIGMLANRKGDTQRALDILMRAADIAKRLGYSQQLTDLYKKFSDIYTSKNDYRNAATYSKMYADLRDSVISKQLIKKLADVQTKYAERENLATISTKEQVIKYQTLIIILVSFATISVLVVALLLYRNNRLRQQANALLESKVKERTRQLQESYLAMEHQALEKTETMEKAHAELKGLMATLRGLVYLSRARADAEGREYLTEAENTLEKAERSVKKYL